MTQQLFSPLSEFTLEALVAREQWAAAQSSTRRKQQVPNKSGTTQQKQAAEKQVTKSEE